MSRPFAGQEREEEHVRVPAVAKRCLPQATLLLEAEAPIERQGALITLFNADADAVHAPTVEAGFQGGLHDVDPESLTPVIGVDQERELDRVSFRPVDADDNQADRIARERLGHERLWSAACDFPREPIFDLSG
jgi:hypothetical protein